MNHPSLKRQPAVLLVDDEHMLVQKVRPFIEQAGLQLLTAADGESALRQAKATHPNLIVLDVTLPKIDGHEVLRRLRGIGDQTPIILLVEQDKPRERTLALYAGADDCLDKPYCPAELTARIKAILRRLPVSRLVCGPLHIDLAEDTVYLNNKLLDLPLTKYKLLKYLILNAGQPCSPRQIEEKVTGQSYLHNVAVVKKWICELRRLLGDDARSPRFIAYVDGGYCFVGRVECK